ncbi:hypothetical protein CASFOL_018231 [Castilleja foliolosa]|uniref:Bifunctional inhibitor/plant lipid transfer protein/seed storage helical domain-containing protein n=1 Tax=Castilleja foliolosa TaxID=1961234 RepID=A0ABD3D649_9LAMI
MKSGAINVVAAWCLVVVLVAEIHQTVAVECNLIDLKVCAKVVRGEPPSPKCCSKLKEKLSCYCDYLKVPTLGPYDSIIFRQALATCAITLPKC